MSPVAETNDPNKRPAIVCDFFAKGWCIRGTSCRFIHTKDSPKNSHPQSEGDVAAASCSREVKVDEGIMYFLGKISNKYSPMIFLLKTLFSNRSKRHS